MRASAANVKPNHTLNHLNGKRITHKQTIFLGSYAQALNAEGVRQYLVAGGIQAWTAFFLDGVPIEEFNEARRTAQRLERICDMRPPVREKIQRKRLHFGE